MTVKYRNAAHGIVLSQDGNTFSTEVDFSYKDESLDEALTTFANAHEVATIVTNPAGPGGGWPSVIVAGPVENVTRAMAEYTGDPEVLELGLESFARVPDPATA